MPINLLHYRKKFEISESYNYMKEILIQKDIHEKCSNNDNTLHVKHIAQSIKAAERERERERGERGERAF